MIRKAVLNLNVNFVYIKQFFVIGHRRALGSAIEHILAKLFTYLNHLISCYLGNVNKGGPIILKVPTSYVCQIKYEIRKKNFFR